MQFNAWFNTVCLYNACLFFFIYFALDFCIVDIYALLFVFMLSLWVVDTWFFYFNLWFA